MMESIILNRKTIESLDRLVEDFRNGDIVDMTDEYTARWWITQRQDVELYNNAIAQ